MSCFKNALIFGDQNFSSGDHFTKESRQKATSEKLELEALFKVVCSDIGLDLRFQFVTLINAPGSFTCTVGALI